MLWAIGFLITFVFGGLTGVILASPPLDFHVSDTYFVVAHFHYVVFGTVVFAMFAGFYFWWPKWTGKMLNERLGKMHFWLLFIGFHTTFLIQHWLGVVAMPRRYYSYLPEDDITWMNQLSTIGAGILGDLDDPVLPERVHHGASSAEGHRRTTRGATAVRSSGRRAARRRVTTSRRSRASAPSAGVRPEPPRGRHPRRHRPAKDAPDSADATTSPTKEGQVECAPTSFCSGSSRPSSPSSRGRLHVWSLRRSVHEPGVEWVGHRRALAERRAVRVHRVLPRPRAQGAGRRAARGPPRREHRRRRRRARVLQPVELVAASSLAAVRRSLFLGLADRASGSRFIGVADRLVALVGWVYEYYRGNFARNGPVLRSIPFHGVSVPAGHPDRAQVPQLQFLRETGWRAGLARGTNGSGRHRRGPDDYRPGLGGVSGAR